MPSMPRKSLLVAVFSLAIAVMLPGSAGALSTSKTDDAALMLADMALSRGDCRGGTDRYLKAAMGTSDAAIAGRATKVAADCQQVEATLRAAKRWQKLEPQSVDAVAALAVGAARLYQEEETSAAILRTRELGGEQALIKLIPEVSDAGGHAIALETLRPIFDAPDASNDLLSAAVDLSLESFDFATSRKYADRMLAAEPASAMSPS